MRCAMKLLGAAVMAQLGSSAGVKARSKSSGSPLETVVKLITQLQSTIVQDGENEAKAYKLFVSWCDEADFNKREEIKVTNKQELQLEAAIANAMSDTDNCNTEIEKLSSAIATNEDDLKAATEVRDADRDAFEKAEKELDESIDMLSRAMQVLEKEMAGGASFVQGKANTASLEKSLVGISAVIDAVGVFTENDKGKLVALVQAREDAEDEADDAGTNALAAYSSISTGAPIIDVMQDMKDKASTQLNALRGEERTEAHNFEMVKQNLKVTIVDGNKALDKQKANLAEANEVKAVSQGQLSTASKSLAEAKSLMEEYHHDCVAKAADREITMQGRKEELAVLAKSKKIIQNAMAAIQTKQGPASADDAAESFLQLGSTSRAHAKAKALAKMKAQGTQVEKLLNRIAHEQHSRALGKLSQKIKSAVQLANALSEDPFAKVKSMIVDMITKLEKEASEEAGEKKYCDEEMGKTTEKRNELMDDTEGIRAKIDEAASESAILKEQVTVLQEELAKLANIQNDIDTTRTEVHAMYKQSTDDIKKGLGGIGDAMQMLREYYNADEEEALLQTSAIPQALSDSSKAANSDDDENIEDDDDASFKVAGKVAKIIAVPYKAANSDDDENIEDDDDSSFKAVMQQKQALSFMQQPAAPKKGKKQGGAGSGIISLLEVIESDLEKSLAQLNTEEEERKDKYERETQDNKVAKADKEQDVALKMAAYKGTDKQISEMESDHATVSSELDAVNEYYGKLKERCVAKPDTYEEKKKRRDAEIKGLQEATEILAPADFLQSARGVV